MNEKKYLKNIEKLMNEWNWEKNNTLNLEPNKLTQGSNKKAWWKCNKGHEWEDTIVHRTGGRNCPYCSNRLLLKGYNDLATIKPDLIKEWNYTKNGTLNPSDIFPKTNKKVWWKCSKGHEWEDTPNHRVSRDNGCPYCSNHQLLRGYNDLEVTNPELAKEWNYAKNGMLTPKEVFHGSQQKVWWVCENGHEWKSTISSRSLGVGCPYCKKELQTSYPEQAIYFYIKKLFPDAINRYVEDNKEIDIFIPSINVGIEYDGERFHNKDTKNKENLKDEYFSKHGIKIIRVKEKKNTELKRIENIIYYKPSFQNRYLNSAIELIIEVIFQNLKTKKPSVDISIERDNNYILNLLVTTSKENSIITNKDLLKEWNYEKNGKLNPEYIKRTSGKKLWWKCSKGHEWEAIVNVRNKGNGCPYCSNQKVLVGYNDLGTTNSKLAKEWNYEKNGKLTPNDVTMGANKKAWWKCNKGHEWEAVISSRNKGAGCPYCANQKVITGINDLETLKPTLIKYWNYEKNDKLKPQDVGISSGKKVWWKCPICKHEWISRVADITRKKHICSKCKKNN